MKSYDEQVHCGKRERGKSQRISFRLKNDKRSTIYFKNKRLGLRPWRAKNSKL